MSVARSPGKNFFGRPAERDVEDEKAISPDEYNQPGPVLHDPSPGRTLRNTSSERHLEAYGGKDAIDWVMGCVYLIAETGSNASYHFENKKGDKLVPEITPELASDDDIEQAPKDLVALISQPNAFINYGELLELTIIDYLMTGNAYWLKWTDGEASTKPSYIFRLPSSLVSVKPGNRRLVQNYEYKPPGRTEPLVYEPYEIIHFKRANPHSEHLGLGVISGGPEVFDTEIFMTRSLRRYFQRGAKLSGVLESERTIPTQTFTKVINQFRKLYSSDPNNDWEVAALEKGLKFRTVQSTAAQAEFKELLGLSRDRIAAAFRVPPALLGQVQGIDRQAVREAQRIFDNKTMRPLLNRFEDVITECLTMAWGVKFKIDYEFELPEEDKLELAQNFATLPGVKVKEVRRYAGLDPLGDERDDLVLNLPGEDDNESEVKDRNLGSEPGRPPLGENTREIPEPGTPLPDDAEARY